MENNEQNKAKSTLICAGICIVCNIILTISELVAGNFISGLGWGCALMANLQLVSYALEKYNNNK